MQEMLVVNCNEKNNYGGIQMNTIRTYIDNLFSTLPITPETARAKEELLAMMEDKYNELKAQGKSENEAVGIVISEFGNIDELKRELNLQDNNSYDNTSNNYPVLSSEEVDEYISRQQKFSFATATGVLLCILSPVVLILLSGLADEISSFPLSSNIAAAIGLGVLLLFVATAVAIFIISGISNERYEYIKRGEFNLDNSTVQNLNLLYEENSISFTIHITAGVILCIIGVIPIVVIGCIDNDFQDIASLFGVTVLLVFVSIAVFLFITGGVVRDCYKKLLKLEEYNEENKDSLSGKIGSVYWPLVIIGYLLWSFLTNDWHITWIVWPIAGILFGAIASLCSIITGKPQNK